MPQDLDRLVQQTLKAADTTPPSRAKRPRKKRVATGSSARQAAMRKQIFLREYAKHGNIAEACRTLKIDRRTAYLWRETDPEFKAAFEQALEVSIDRLELEARRRAEEGVEEPIYQGGRLVGSKIVYSDQLMALMLRAKRPQEYGNGQLFGRGEIGQVTFTLDFGFAKTPELADGPPALEGEVIEGSAREVQSPVPDQGSDTASPD